MNKVYIIWDTKENKQWSRGAKSFWPKSGSAKNSFMISYSSMGYYEACKRIGEKNLTNEWKKSYELWERRYMTFKDQTRYECWECDVVRRDKK